MGAVASKYSVNPNMLRNWKKEFLGSVRRIFSERKTEKEARRKGDSLKKDCEQMLKTIRQPGLSSRLLSHLRVSHPRLHKDRTFSVDSAAMRVDRRSTKLALPQASAAIQRAGSVAENRHTVNRLLAYGREDIKV